MLNLNCVICAELFTHADDVYVTTCGHMFHYACLKQWMERSKTCPQCRNRCTERNIFRVYFNLANLDVSRIDVGSLQEQLDTATLSLKMKEKELEKTEEKTKNLKETQKKCMKTIAALEQKIQKNDFIILGYADQLKMYKSEVKLMESLRAEIKTMKQQMEAMDGVNTLLTASSAEAEKLLRNESDPKILSIWVATLKRELRVCENKKSDVRMVLKSVQNDLRKEIDFRKTYEERISQLESENYQLMEKIKILETNRNNNNNVYTMSQNASAKDINRVASIKNASQAIPQHVKKDERQTLSPTIKENIKKIEESSSPYLNIKSCSLVLGPLLKRNNEKISAFNGDAASANNATSRKFTTLKISPSKSGVIRKTSSDISHKYSILKKPRLGSVSTLGANYAFNGFGGSDRIDPFERSYSDHDDNIIDIDRDAPSSSAAATATKTKTLSINSRLKSGGLRKMQLPKSAKS